MNSSLDNDTSLLALYDSASLDDVSDSPVDLGRRLAAARSEAGIDRDELAVTIGVSPDEISAWESGEDTPRGHRLSKLAGILGVSLSWLIVGHGEDSVATDDADSSPAEMIASVRRQLASAAYELSRIEQRLDSK